MCSLYSNHIVSTFFMSNSITCKSREEQLAVTLYCFGHNGNGASLQQVANWAGMGKGIVHLVTQRVMTAILRPDFMRDAVRYPTPEEKEKAKVWIEAHLCKAWWNGWCMVDGTLILLYNRPFWLDSFNAESTNCRFWLWLHWEYS
ncbi:hypothetical protein BJ138DRAFT_1108223 [Hygrophoropsis aurantiaca]|uniref:Uncharacterized protein n=1 Tax=Hygrophoropsis aurantiaca TaxID=72124 RepID=A0ACB7ZQ36_9AGAM|nr:hypothetical protein BJ138DRAFT_1108223 [Hygrophoropsis aurantiaca]